VGSPESLDRPFVHHIGVFASGLALSGDFRTAALAPLGVRIGYGTVVTAEYRPPGHDTPAPSLEQTVTERTRGVHIAFAAGGRSRHAPRRRPGYRADRAFVSDPDGDNFEAVHKEES
jgi:hypothetical protein